MMKIEKFYIIWNVRNKILSSREKFIEYDI